MAGLNVSELARTTALNDALSVFPVEEHDARTSRPADRIVFVLVDVDEYVIPRIDPAPVLQPQVDWRLTINKFIGPRSVMLTSIALSFAVLTASGVRYLSVPERTVASVPAPSRVETPALLASRPLAPRSLAAPLSLRPVIRQAASTRRPSAPAVTHQGRLNIDSVPQGAIVFINQQQVGVTPLDLPRQRAGSYAVWVQREGFQRWTAGVLVPASKTTRITAKLESSR